jgi:ribosome-associated protein
MRITPPISGSVPTGTHSAPATPTHPITKIALRTLDDKKAEAILPIDVRGKCSFADEMLVASGRSARHVASLADDVVEALEKEGHEVLSLEGKDNADWVLIDAGDVIIHLFRHEVREFYNLEKMWAAPAATDAESPHYL